MSDATPQKVGWYWFLPDERCASITGILRIDRPVVVLVGVDKVTRDMPPARFVVRFPNVTLYVDDMSGDWEAIQPPERMRRVAFGRFTRKGQQIGRAHV